MKANELGIEFRSRCGHVVFYPEGEFVPGYDCGLVHQNIAGDVVICGTDEYTQCESCVEIDRNMLFREFGSGA